MIHQEPILSPSGRWFTIFLITLAILGCSKGRHDADGTLRIYSRLWTPLREQSFIRGELERFYSESGIEAELILYTDGDMDRMLATGDLSDVDLVIPYGNRLSLWSEKVDFVDFHEYPDLFQDRTFLFELLPPEKQSVWRNFLPIGADVYLVIVSKNAESLKPAGIENAGLTWPDLADWIRIVSREQGRGMLAVTGVPDKNLVYFLAGPVLSYGGGFPDLASGAAVDALRMLQDMRRGFHPAVENFDSVIDPLVGGSAWFAFAHCAHVGFVLKEAPGRFNVYTAPSGPAGQGSVSGFSAIGIPARTGNRQDALSLVEYLTRPDVQIRISKGVGGFIPTVLEAGEFLGNDALDTVIRYGLDVLHAGRTRDIPHEYGEWGNVKHVYETVFYSLILSDNEISADSLRWAQTELEKLKLSP